MIICLACRKAKGSGKRNGTYICANCAIQYKYQTLYRLLYEHDNINVPERNTGTQSSGPL